MRDLLQLDLSRSIRQIGKKTRMEVLAALESSGLRHPSLEGSPASEVTKLAQSLERMQSRIHSALRSVDREIGVVQKRLRKKMGEAP